MFNLSFPFGKSFLHTRPYAKSTLILLQSWKYIDTVDIFPVAQKPRFPQYGYVKVSGLASQCMHK